MSELWPKNCAELRRLSHRAFAYIEDIFGSAKARYTTHYTPEDTKVVGELPGTEKSPKADSLKKLGKEPISTN